MIYRRLPAIVRWMPDVLQRQVLFFESRIEDSVREFAAALPPEAHVLDAGAGEGQYAQLFSQVRYTAVDLGVGDQEWSYSELDAVADLEHLPFQDSCFDACLNIVTLEHVREPRAVVCELGRVTRRGGRVLVITPLDWEEHQQPHDYYRYTRYGLEYLLNQGGFRAEKLQPAGGFFRLLARRLMNAPQFFPRPLDLIVLGLLSVPAILLGLLDGLDRKQHFTLGHICVAKKL